MSNYPCILVVQKLFQALKNTQLRWVFFLFVGMLSNTAHANLDDRIASIAKNKTWLRLMHYSGDENGTLKSDVLSPQFFLSGHGEENSIEELKSTIQALNNPHGKAKCWFPARYYWLSETVPELVPKFDLSSCENLSQWFSSVRKGTVRAMMVNSYFGNPASSFGHALLAVSSSDAPTYFNDLLDEGVNYGAKIPKGENMFLYILKGVFGGYVANFSNKKFYTHDLTYSRGENRDMWGYELKLTDYQKTLLLTHLWELRNIHFQYYFATKNCAYKLAELLELSFDDPNIGDYLLAYRPIDLFHELDELNNVSGGEVLGDINYYPSLQQELYASYQALPSVLKNRANEFLKNYSKDDLVTNLSSQESSQLLDFFVDYYAYQQAGKIEKDSKNKKLYNYFISQRFRLPPSSDRNVGMVAVNLRPTDKPRAAKLHFRIGSRENNTFAAMSASPYSHDLLSWGGDGHSAFTVLDVGIESTEGELSLQQLNLVDVKSYSPRNVDLYGESSWAWGVSAGWSRSIEKDGELEFSVNGELGKAFSLTNGLTAYTLATAAINAPLDKSTLGIKTGILLSAGVFKAQLELAGHVDEQGNDAYLADASVAFRSSQNTDLRASYTGDLERTDHDGEFALTFNFYW